MHDLTDVSKDQEEKRFILLIDQAPDGKRIRQLVEILAFEYARDPEALKRLFTPDPASLRPEGFHLKVGGLASSAYYLLTGDIKPIQQLEYGGLGVTITESEEGLSFGQHQLMYAMTSGNALRNSFNTDEALKYSENSENALWGSENSGSALARSINSGYALAVSKNLERAAHCTINTGKTFRASLNSDMMGHCAHNFEEVGALSTNSGRSWKSSHNCGNVFANARTSENALENAIHWGDLIPDYDSPGVERTKDSDNSYPELDPRFWSLVTRRFEYNESLGKWRKEVKR